jgi:exopolyphosphatase/guanosine-5'-triphosphate,3'-diphosphate pyrophosphatase
LYAQEITRLSGGLRQTGKLSSGGRELTLSSISAFVSKIKKLNVSEMVVAGTEALRSAEDALDFLGEIKKVSDSQVRVLSAQEEAMLTALGVCASLQLSSPTMILDIGGGSTEISLVSHGMFERWFSLPLGVVKLLESASPQNPYQSDDIARMASESRVAAAKFKDQLSANISQNTVLVGTAGTPTTAAAIDLRLREYDRKRVHGHVLSLGMLNEMLDFLAGLRAEERAGLDGLEPKRADLIIPGIILTIGIMKSLGFHEMTVSDQGLLEGLLLDLKGVRTLAF